MRKRDELVSGCMAKAGDHEMTFVLLSRDPTAPEVIRYWATLRCEQGRNFVDDHQILEALECACVMEEEGKSRKPAPDGAQSMIADTPASSEVDQLRADLATTRTALEQAEKATLVAEREMRATKCLYSQYRGEAREEFRRHEESLSATRTALQNAQEALSNLTTKLREVQSNEQFKSVWAFAYVHGFSYTGPNWADALAACELLLKESASIEEK